MSVRYPVPTPMRVDRNPRVSTAKTADPVIFLPAASVDDVQLPSLLMAPMQPPQGPRL